MKGSFISIFMHADRVDLLLMFIGFLGSIGDGIALPAAVYFISEIINTIGSPTQSSGENINKIVLLTCYVACWKGIASFLGGYCWTRTAARQASAMRSRYLKALLRQDVEYFDLHVTSTAEVIATVSRDSQVIQEVMSEKVPTFLMNISMFVGMYATAFLMVSRLALVGFPFVVLLVVPGIVYGRTLTVIATRIRDENNKAGSIVEQAVSSIRTVYSFVGETKTVKDYSAGLEGAFKLGLRQGLAKALAMCANGVVFVNWSFMVYYGSGLVINHGMKGGSIYNTGNALNLGGQALGATLSSLSYFSDAGAAAESIKKVMDREPKIDSENMNGEVPENVLGEVEFRNVGFAYPSRPDSMILNGFNLRIPAGKTVALVGGSGSGKSTVISLLQRFYNPVGGEIFLDGMAINRIQVKFLRSQMGLVSQEPALFATTIKENILFGKEDASDEEVIDAARAANVHDFISLLPRGYDTQVGERGVHLSGGQKQRIAIARAIIKAPKILLLDEATSALDTESERVVQEALDEVAVGRTTIIIAHRLSTIQNSDTIAVVQNGQVLETGSHHQLIIEEDSLYANLVRLQETQTTNQADQTETPATATTSLPISSEPNDVNSSNLRLPVLKRSSSVNPLPVQNIREMKPSYRRLLAMNVPEWKQALFGCICSLLYGAIQPTYALAMGSMLSIYFSQDHNEIKEKRQIYTIGFAGIGVFSILISLCQHYNFAVMGECLAKRIRENMLSKILTFEIGWFDKDENSTGAICSRLATDANTVRALVGDQVALIIQTFSGVTTAYTMSLIISWRFAIVIIAIQPLMIISLYWQKVLLKTTIQKSTKAQEESGKIAAEAVSNHRTVAAFGSQSRILKILETAQVEPRRESNRQSWVAGIGLGAVSTLSIFCWAFCYWYGGRLLATNSLGAKPLFQTIMILLGTGRVISDAATLSNSLSLGSSSIESVFSILDRRTIIEPDDSDGHRPDDVIGHVDIREVDFAYPSRPDIMIFQGFSLEIEAGKSTALVGPSGSGKSTIIGLIERFYNPLNGVVNIDGKDIRSYHLRTLRKHIALVSQEPALFAGTVRQNITYGSSEEISESEIIEAAKVANAHDFITGLKDGYDTSCGDKGLQLSGGQKQRIAIARAVLKNPAILLLDEATSALDSQSEKVVQDALEKIMVGRTSVVVAHRLSTVQSCNMIAVLNKGQVVEKGTHAELLEIGHDGVYFSLACHQRTAV